MSTRLFARQTLRTYESLLRTQGHNSVSTSNRPHQLQQAHPCPFCEKYFESASYLDLHISRRHSKGTDQILEKRLSAVLSKAEESTTARLKTEAATIWESYFQKLRSPSQVNFQRSDGIALEQVSSLQTALKESNDKLKDAQQQLETLQSSVQIPFFKELEIKFGDFEHQIKHLGQENANLLREVNATYSERLKELEIKFGDFEHQIKQLGQENANLLRELNATYSKASVLKPERRHIIRTMGQHDEQVEELQKEIQQLRKSLREDYGQPFMETKPRPIKEWLHEAEDVEDVRSWDGALSRFTHPRRLERDEIEDEERRVTNKVAENKYTKRAVAVAADALEDTEDCVPVEKERWLREHPYTPILQLPYALAKYQHSATLFAPQHEEVSKHLDRLLRQELRKFGISPHAQGISDAKYAVIAAALDKQRAFQQATASLNERRIMEYERSTILWHIERSVRAHDMDIIESILDEGSDLLSIDDEYTERPDENDETETVMVSEWRQKMEKNHELHRSYENNSRRSTSRLDSEELSTYEDPHHTEVVEVLPFSKASPLKHDDDDFETQTFQVAGHLATRTISPSLNQQSQVLLSRVSSPAGLQGSGEPEEDVGLGEWQSDESTAHSNSQ